MAILGEKEFSEQMLQLAGEINALLVGCGVDSEVIIFALIEVLGQGMEGTARDGISREEFDRVVTRHANLVREIALIRFDAQRLH